MKRTFTVLLFSITALAFGQTQCVSLTGYNTAYLNTVSTDDITYPPGSAFITSGDIQYLKHDVNDMYQFVMSDTLMYIGDLDIDVSNASCSDRTLSFSVIYLDGMIVDGDTIFTTMPGPTNYTGSGFTMSHVANTYTLTGNFDVVTLRSSTNFLFDVCLTCNANNCVSLAAYDNAYLNMISIDDVTYPAGYAFVSSGDIEYLKHDSNDYYQFIMGDSLLYIGDLDISVANAPCADRTLTFSVAYLDEMWIDGDTVFTGMNPPASYNGSGWSMSYNGSGHYTVTGNFDIVTLSSSTNFLFDVCLSCDSLSCVSLAAYDDAYLNTISMDDVTYPPGYAFVTSGDIRYLKHDANDYYQFIMSDSLLYIGDLDISVSTAACTTRTLTFSVIYLEGMSVDGDTLFTMMNPPASFNGTGWTMSYDGSGHYTVTGNFDVVTLHSSTNILFDVCLACSGLMSMEDNPILPSFSLYPNPTTDVLYLDAGTMPLGTSYTIMDISGKLVSSGRLTEYVNSISTTELSNGLYFLRVNDQPAVKFIKQ